MDERTRNILYYTVPVLMGFALIVTVVWGRAQKARADEYERLSDEYAGRYVSACARCGRELADSVSSMAASLSKLRVTSSAQGRVLALEDIARESAEAAALRSRMPQSQAENMALSSFLTRTGDYARSLSKRLLAGDEPDETDIAQLDALLSACEELSHKLSESIANGEMPVGTEEYDFYDVSETERAYRDGEPSEPDYPTLIYDGPFSESTEKREPKGLSGAEGSAGEAQSIASAIAGEELEYSGRTDGPLPSYDFTSEDGKTDVSVTVRGLMPLYFMRAPKGSKSGVPEREEYERLAAVGIMALSRMGYKDMTPTYAQYYDGAALISFAWMKDGAVIYNDLIKVWIDRETEKLCGLDARNYLYSHTERDALVPAISREEALKSVSAELRVTNSRLALIPLTPNTEALCWEFRGECGGREYVVYVNAGNGREEQVFMIINDENGQSAV